MRNKIRMVLVVLVCVFTFVSTIGCQENEIRDNDETKTTEEKLTEDATTENAKSSDNEDPKLDKSEYYEITLYTENYDPEEEAYAEQNSFRKYLKEKYNFGYKVVAYPGDMMEYTALMLSAGNYPDLMRLISVELINSYVDAGALLALDPLMDKYGPSFKDYHKPYLPLYRTLCSVDTSQTWVFGFSRNASFGISNPYLEWVIRSDILKQQGYPDIVDEDDLIRIIKKGMEDNPETNGKPTIGLAYPFAAFGTVGATVSTYLYNLGKYHHMTLNNGMIFDFDTEKFVDVAKTEDFLEAMKFWNRLYNEGILGRESLTDNFESYEAKMKEGIPLCNWFFNWAYTNYNSSIKEIGKDYRYVPMTSMMKYQIERGDDKQFCVEDCSAWISLGITDNAKYPERLMEVLDFCASHEGHVLSGWGPKGVNYTLNDDGIRVATEEYFENKAENAAYIHTFRGNNMLGFNNFTDDNGQLYYIETDANVCARSMDPVILDVWGNYGWDNLKDMYYNNKNFNYIPDRSQDLKTSPPQTITEEQKDNLILIKEDEAATIMKLVTASDQKEFDKIYNQFIDKRNDLGMQEILKAWNEEYSQYVEDFGIGR